MKRTQLAIGVVGIAITLAAESPVCRRILVPVIHPHHSKATLAKWAEWNKTHVPPTPKQVLAEIDLACPEVKTFDSDQVDFIIPTEPPVWIDSEVTPDTAVMPQVALVEIEYYLPSTPLFLPRLPAAAPVPEPSSILLLLTGMLAVCFKKKVRA